MKRPIDKERLQEESIPIEKKKWYKTEMAKNCYAPYYPGEKKATWWIIMQDKKANKVIAMNKISGIDKPTVCVHVYFNHSLLGM
jgi:hypothetical protein